MSGGLGPVGLPSLPIWLGLGSVPLLLLTMRGLALCAAWSAGAYLPAVPGCAASSGPASRALAALARAVRDLFPVAGHRWCRLRRLLRRPGRRSPLAVLARGKTSWPPRAARLDLPFPSRRGHLTAGKGTTAPGRHQGRPALPVTSTGGTSREPDPDHHHRPARR